MFDTDMALQTRPGLVDLGTVRAGVAEAVVRLHMSSHIILVFLFFPTVVALPD